jgi:uncharacterized protein (DUF2147 family)
MRTIIRLAARARSLTVALTAGTRLIVLTVLTKLTVLSKLTALTERTERTERTELTRLTRLTKLTALTTVAALTALTTFPGHSAAAAASAATADSPIGLWKTIDDKTGAARAIVRIYERDGRLFGKIESSFTEGADHRVCKACTDERKDQPIIGLLIIRNMKHSDDEYGGGDILDPDTGSVYRCKMHVEGGTRLVLRGYIGFSLLGRNQTWLRVPETAGSP